MDQKTLIILEYPKILERLASYTAFAASSDKARALQPTGDVDEARRRQEETAEAVQLLATSHDLTIGGARDVREPVDLARHGGVLTPGDLLDVRSTLVAARTLARTFERIGSQYPNLTELAMQLPQPPGLIDAITRVFSDRGEILDSASDRLSEIRHDLRVTHERLMTKLQRMVADPKNAPYLQEAIITQRDGRYVIPLRSEFKGRIRAIVHDQSSSGATLFVEPISVVDANNQYRELQLAERDEERRILAELSRMVGMAAEEIQIVIDIVADLDLAFARAKYAFDLSAFMPVLHAIPKQPRPLSQPGGKATTSASGEREDGGEGGAGSRTDSAGESADTQKILRHPGTVIKLYEARHPLLDPETVVPIDVELDPQTFALVITGPNTGGKTVSLKTVGLLALMAQSGLHIPAGRSSEISVFEDVYADIGDEQSIEQSLSTFSGHVTNIIHILARATPRSLVILDELGAGTDPQEGAALARALLTHVLERGITTLVTTHHPELKAFAHATPGVVNASVEFDLETLRPTYHLTIGLPGRSNALAIAGRLGMPRPIIDDARSELSPEDKRSWGLLDEIHRQRDMARQARSAADQARQEAEELRARLSERLEKLEDERRAVLEKARTEAEAEVQALQEEIRQARQQLARARQPLEPLKVVEEKASELEDKVEKPVERKVPQVGGEPIRRAIRPGDKVRLRSLNTLGVVTSLGEEEAEVLVGNLRIRARLSDLVFPSETVAPEPSKAGERGKGERRQSTSLGGRGEGDLSSAAASRPTSAVDLSSPGMELDLRGQRADDALDALDRYLDSAYLSGMPFVRVIHGKGTGRLREAVRQALQQNPHVRSFEPGGEKEGGEGVTVVKL